MPRGEIVGVGPPPRHRINKVSAQAAQGHVHASRDGDQGWLAYHGIVPPRVIFNLMGHNSYLRSNSKTRKNNDYVSYIITYRPVRQRVAMV
jgi:hypothetical protein